MAHWTRAETLASVALVVAAAFAVSARAADDARALEFRRFGEPVATRSLAELQNVAKSERIRVYEPYEHRDAEFRALPLAAILESIYSPSWRSDPSGPASDLELLFTCRDGYQPTVPVSRVLAHPAWLAFERIGGDGFSILKLESGRRQRIDLSPYYLIWGNVDDQSLRSDGDYGWPYQVVGIELIHARDRFPHMAPAASANAQVQAGFAAFRVNCSRCHTVNGDGGHVGPELNTPGSPAGARDPAWLRRWIDDPSKILAVTRMPPLNRDLPHRKRVLSSIVAYLQAMARGEVAQKPKEPAGEAARGQ